MTYSILARDAETGILGGAAATGSLCVGGWVLRGRVGAGMSASQGTAPSTLWGDAVLDRMQAGETAESAVASTVSPDAGRDYRQLSALDLSGGTGAFTGAHSVPAASHRSEPGAIVAGNLLTGEEVLDAALAAYSGSTLPFAERLLAALDAGAAAGSDSRGLQSAALLILGSDMAPLTLRIDMSDRPLAALRALYERSQSQPYAGWCDVVPTFSDPFRAPQPDEMEVVAEQASSKA
ncbi:major pilin protein fimA [Oceanicola sp. 22II-s10i]|uniref:DUF1028 domain-containing protein n=1 Tax=Oceanicola sp. 22II-s10i TaxID=1317116 RepID=UPI000B5259C1|nr:DUF1028 domain-containing protein [Oceanicola sp. 22II-s10i]OWU85156.1 major pilin protein fimA [Oceanicola sp. 22II-s10i]